MRMRGIWGARLLDETRLEAEENEFGAEVVLQAPGSMSRTDQRSISGRRWLKIKHWNAQRGQVRLTKRVIHRVAKEARRVAPSFLGSLNAKTAPAGLRATKRTGKAD